MRLGVVINPVHGLAGSTKILIPMASATDIPTVPAETFTNFQVSFYNAPVDAVHKALGLDIHFKNKKAAYCRFH